MTPKRLADRLSEIKARLDAATPGPWFAHHCQAGKKTDCWCKVVGTSPDPTNEAMDSVVGFGSASAKNAELIANAPTDIAYLVRIIEAAAQVVRAAEKISNPRLESCDHPAIAREALANLNRLLSTLKKGLDL